MPLRRLAAIVRKEILEALRAGWYNIPATAVLTTMLVASGLSARVGRLPPDLVPVFQVGVLLFVPLLSMPFYAGTVLSRAIQMERVRGGMMPLLACGASPAEVWLGKVLGAFALSYVVMLASLALYVGWAVWSAQHAWPAPRILPHLFVSMPVAALFVIALQAAMFWCLPRSSLLAVLMPLVIMFGGAQLIAVFGVMSVTGASCGAAIPLSVSGIALLTMWIHRFPRDRAAGLA